MIQPLPNSHYKRMPWQNGFGVTAEIDRFPSGEAAYAWRLSQATVKRDGPFSVFRGYDRWLAVWRGGPLYLNDDKMEALRPRRFPGDQATFGRVAGGPVQDVGLIFDRARVDARMSIVEGRVSLPADQVHYLFDIATGDTLKIDHAEKRDVAQSLFTSVWFIER